MDYSEHSDGDLLLIFKSGDAQAFDVLFHRHWKSLFCMAKKILEDDDLAKDTIQEAFISLFEQARKKEIIHVKTYVYQAVKFQCFMHLRSGKISVKHLARLQTVAAANNVEEYMDVTELQRVMQHEIEFLPEKCREVFYLSRYGSLSNREIAEKLNISPKTVEYQITKALKALRLSVDKLALTVCLLYF